MAELFDNPGFENGGLTGWTAVDSGGRAFSTTPNAISETASAKPVIGAPGYSVLYQNIDVPAGTSQMDLSFQLLSSFSPRGSVDLREMVRVDILSSDVDVTNAAANILANLYFMTPQDANVAHPITVFADLAAYAGQTVTFRIYVADYQGAADFAFDNITTSLSNPATNTAPTFAGIPAAPLLGTTGQDLPLPLITVADAEDNQLTLTLTAAGGSLENVRDADALIPGIQIVGSAAEINLALASVTFKTSLAGVGSIDFSLSDGTAPAVTQTILVETSQAIDVAKAFSGVLGGSLSDADIAKVESEIAGGAYTFQEYIAGLIQKAQNTSVPSLIVSNILGGSAPSESHMSELIDFAQQQFDAYANAGSNNPTLGVYEALGLGFSETADFSVAYSSLNTDGFINTAYSMVFGYQAGDAQVAHFEAQIAFFEALYREDGQAADVATLHARGAVMGQMIGHATIDEASSLTYDDQANSFLQSAAIGNGAFGQPLGMI